MKKKLFLHFGMHRAQSTSIQYGLNYLFNQPGERIFYYPNSFRTPPYTALEGHCLAVVDNKLSDELFTKFLSEVSTVPDYVPIILSSEEFWRINPEDFIPYLKSFEIFPICIKREFYSWLLSIWSLKSLENDFCFTPREFIDGAVNDYILKRSTGDVSFFDVNGVLSRWSDIFSVNLHIYDWPQAYVFKNLFELMDLNPPESWLTMDVNTNSSQPLEKIIINFRQEKNLQLEERSLDVALYAEYKHYLENTIETPVPDAIDHILYRYLSLTIC